MSHSIRPRYQPAQDHVRSNAPYMQPEGFQRQPRPARQAGVARAVAQHGLYGSGGMGQPLHAVPPPRGPAYKLSATTRNQPAPDAAIGQQPAAAPQTEGDHSSQVRVKQEHL